MHILYFDIIGDAFVKTKIGPNNYFYGIGLFADEYIPEGTFI